MTILPSRYIIAGMNMDKDPDPRKWSSAQRRAATEAVIERQAFVNGKVEGRVEKSLEDATIIMREAVKISKLAFDPSGSDLVFNALVNLAAEVRNKK